MDGEASALGAGRGEVRLLLGGRRRPRPPHRGVRERLHAPYAGEHRRVLRPIRAFMVLYVTASASAVMAVPYVAGMLLL
ncbi:MULTISPECIES: hypothetical protein [unclassified Nocardiopsis]|uniref:hypothetical protein n=1 Tax=unclassified Nocardiopsis TaxID=2649073 RepID=UPI00135A923B|nr:MULTISPECIES: hypothetical protein [unclassified Nocardiopsis]